jgi:DNA-binding response OmpR family regulator
VKHPEDMTREELEEEVTEWRRAEGLTEDAVAVAALSAGLGITRTTARYALVLRAANGRRVTRHALVEEGSRGSAACDAGAAVHVSRLRRALGPQAITTDWGHGYALTPEGIAKVDAALSERRAV